MDLGRLQDVGEQPFADWCQQPDKLAGPAAHQVPIDVHALSAKDHRLSIPGLMIDEAADNQMRQQGAARHDLGQRQIDGRSLADLLACPASDARTDMRKRAGI